MQQIPLEYRSQQLTIICPVTQLPLATGVQITAVTFATAVFANVRVQCPHCGGEHRWSNASAFLLEIAAGAPAAGGFGLHPLPAGMKKLPRVPPG